MAKRAGHCSLLGRFRRLGHYWTPLALGWPSLLEWALIFVFLILADSVGGWTVDVFMACPANTVLAAFPRHSAMNDVIKKVLRKAGLPSLLEPPGLDRGNGSRLDGITVFPFSGDRSLVWDCKCVDTIPYSNGS